MPPFPSSRGPVWESCNFQFVILNLNFDLDLDLDLVPACDWLASNALLVLALVLVLVL